MLKSYLIYLLNADLNIYKEVLKIHYESIQHYPIMPNYNNLINLINPS